MSSNFVVIYPMTPTGLSCAELHAPIDNHDTVAIRKAYGFGPDEAHKRLGAPDGCTVVRIQKREDNDNATVQ